MNILLAGLSARDAAAVERLVAAAWSGVRVDRRDRGAAGGNSPVGVVGGVDLCVVDLAGMGWAQWSAGHEADLLQMLRGRAAVALVPPGGGGGWLDVRHGGVVRQALEWVSKPCTALALRAALDRIRPALRQAAATAGSAAVMAPPPPPVVASGPGLGLMPTEVAALEHAFPALRSNPFIDLLLRLLVSDQPQELRLDARHALVVHPAQGWVAGNLSQAVLLRLVRFDANAAAFHFRALGAGEATERSLTIGRHEALETFVWRLAAGGFDQAPLRAEHNLAFKLHRFPDFAWMQDASDLQLQLATLCLRSRQSLRGLQRRLPSHDAAAIARFVLCAVLSGQASIEPAARAEADAPATAIPAPLAADVPALPAAAPPAAPARPGFLRALLARLF